MVYISAQEIPRLSYARPAVLHFYPALMIQTVQCYSFMTVKICAKDLTTPMLHMTLELWSLLCPISGDIARLDLTCAHASSSQVHHPTPWESSARCDIDERGDRRE